MTEITPGAALLIAFVPTSLFIAFILLSQKWAIWEGKNQTAATLRNANKYLKDPKVITAIDNIEPSAVITGVHNGREIKITQFPGTSRTGPSLTFSKPARLETYFNVRLSGVMGWFIAPVDEIQGVKFTPPGLSDLLTMHVRHGGENLVLTADEVAAVNQLDKIADFAFAESNPGGEARVVIHAYLSSDPPEWEKSAILSFLETF